jgi:hypothetical protein
VPAALLSATTLVLPWSIGLSAFHAYLQVWFLQRVVRILILPKNLANYI